MSDVAHEQFMEALRKIFGWSQAPGRPRQKQLIFMLAPAPDTNTPAPPDNRADKAPAKEDPQI